MFSSQKDRQTGPVGNGRLTPDFFVVSPLGLSFRGPVVSPLGLSFQHWEQQLIANSQGFLIKTVKIELSDLTGRRYTVQSRNA